MKKLLPFLLLVTVFTGLGSMAAALGRRSPKPVQPSYHLTSEEVLPSSRTVLRFVEGRPAVVTEEDSLRFLSPTGQVLASRERTRSTGIFLSEEGDCIGIQELVEPAGGSSVLVFDVLDLQGNRRYSIKLPVDEDEPMPSFYLSPKGAVVVLKPLTAGLFFYDRAGTLQRSLELFADAVPEVERPVGCAFSADGDILAVNALRAYAKPTRKLPPGSKARSELILFDDRGVEMWRRELESEISNRVAISPDGRVLVAGGYRVKGLDVVEQATFLYDAGGELLASLDVPFRFAAFSADGRSVALAHKSSLQLIDTADGRVFWEKTFSADEGQVRTLDLSADGSIVLVELTRGAYREAQFVHHSPQVYLYDRGGRQVWHGDFSEDDLLQPVAGFLEDGSRFLLAFQNRYLIYAPEE